MKTDLESNFQLTAQQQQFLQRTKNYDLLIRLYDNFNELQWFITDYSQEHVTDGFKK